MTLTRNSYDSVTIRRGDEQYHQIELTSEQFRKLSDVLAGMFQVEDGVMLPLVENVCINVADLENFVVE